jgi:hypothetical protein
MIHPGIFYAFIHNISYIIQSIHSAFIAQTSQKLPWLFAVFGYKNEKEKPLLFIYNKG